MDRDDEDDDGSEESEEEEEQERGLSQNGGRRSQSLHFPAERREDVVSMVYAVQQEGETKAKRHFVLCAFFSWVEMEDGEM